MNQTLILGRDLWMFPADDLLASLQPNHGSQHGYHSQMGRKIALHPFIFNAVKAGKPCQYVDNKV
jgi:hypothetical protein